MSDAEEIERLTGLIEATDNPSERAELLFERGRLRWKAQDRAGAITDYASSAALEPEGGASIALAQAREIMNFYNRDLYNP